MVAINLKAFTPNISDRQFIQLCRDNPDSRLELDAQRNLIAMPPTGSDTGRKNVSLSAQIWNWNNISKLGVVFDSSTGFTLPNGAIRSPDVSWILKSRWDSLSHPQQKKFAPIVPDLVIELMSLTDNLYTLQQKMLEYQSCGVQVGWLIIPASRQIEVYRQNKPKRTYTQPDFISDQDLLPGLEIDLAGIL